MKLLRQFQAELRKLRHPLVAGAVLVAAVAISSLQVVHEATPYPGPSIRDLAGCLRIAALQHATGVGFGLGGVLAAVGTAEDISNGTILDLVLREPRRFRLVLIKCGTAFGVLLGSVLISVGALWASSVLVRRAGHPLPARGSSSWPAAATDAGCSLLVILFIALLSVTLGLLTRSAIATIVLSIAIYFLPLTILDSSILWVTPTRWVVEWLQLDPFGEGVDYLGDNSAYDYRGAPAAAGGLLLLAACVVLCWFSARLMNRAAGRPPNQV